MPTDDPDQSVLGEAQWTWFESQLREPADIRIIATPIQLIADGHNWEAWRMYPRERDRLEGKTPYPLYELSTSSLNIPLTTWVKNPVDEPGPHRLFRPYYESNYGMVNIDWDSSTINLQVLAEDSRIVHEVIVHMSELTP